MIHETRLEDFHVFYPNMEGFLSSALLVEHVALYGPI